jgi:hypothetical protein
MPLTSTSIFEAQPWLEARDLQCVLGDDLDSVMSGVLMHHLFGWQVVGFYEKYHKIWYTNDREPSDLRNAVWLDLDISREYIKSIGHHILKGSPSDNIPAHALSVNPNLLRGVTGQIGIGSSRDHGADCVFCDGLRFPHKYPLGTIHFLLWLYNVALPTNNLPQVACLWLPDSSWINGQSQYYRLNVLDWVRNWIPHPALMSTVEQIDSEGFEHIMRDGIFPRLENIGFGRGRGQSQSRYLRLGGYQCQFANPNIDRLNIQRLADLISEIFGWRRLIIPDSFSLLEGRRNPVAYTLAKVRGIYGGLNQFLIEEDVFSYVIPNNGMLNYSKEIEI